MIDNFALVTKVCLLFQSTSMAYDEVDEVNVYTCVGHPLRQDIENIVNWLLNEAFFTAYSSILHPLISVHIMCMCHVISELQCVWFVLFYIQ